MTRELNLQTKRAFSQARDSLKMLAMCHRKRWESPIGEDCVLGVYWLDMLKGLRGMLNGDTGDIDCGAFDASLTTLARDNGFTDEEF